MQDVNRKWVKVAQLCPTLCDPMDYTIHGILQARMLEWIAFPFSRESSQLRDRTQVSRITGRFFTAELPGISGFHCGSVGQESACSVEDLGSIPGWRRSLGGGNCNPLQYSCLENLNGQRILVGYSPWSCKESDMTEWLSTAQQYGSSTILSF